MDLYRQKKDDCWLWWAIDRASKSVLGWTLGGSWNRNGRAVGGATASRPPGQVCHRLLASLRQNLRRPKPGPRQGAHLYHRKPEQPHPVLPGPSQTPDPQRQKVQRKSGRQHPVFYHQQMWRGAGVKNIINTYLAIPQSAGCARRRTAVWNVNLNIMLAMWPTTRHCATGRFTIKILPSKVSSGRKLLSEEKILRTGRVTSGSAIEVNINSMMLRVFSEICGQSRIQKLKHSS